MFAAHVAGAIVFATFVACAAEATRRWSGVLAALVFPTFEVAFYFSLAGQSPHGTWGSPAYSQVAFVPLLQTASSARLVRRDVHNVAVAGGAGGRVVSTSMEHGLAASGDHGGRRFRAGGSTWRDSRDADSRHAGGAGRDGGRPGIAAADRVHRPERRGGYRRAVRETGASGRGRRHASRRPAGKDGRILAELRMGRRPGIRANREHVEGVAGGGVQPDRAHAKKKYRGRIQSRRKNRGDLREASSDSESRVGLQGGLEAGNLRRAMGPHRNPDFAGPGFSRDRARTRGARRARRDGAGVGLDGLGT